MKHFAVTVVLVAGLTLIGCGSNNSKSTNINGTWNATLVSGGTSPDFTFGTTMTENSDGTVSISSFSFSTNSPCFVSGETESGSFGLTGNFNGQVNGTFGMTVKSGTPSGNTLTLNGTVNGSTITGNWTLAGSSNSCTGSGTFTMTKM